MGTDLIIDNYKVCDFYLEVKWSNGQISKFDFLWLRDNCPSAFHPQTRERNFNLLSVSEDISPEKVILNEDSFCIDWQDQHRSVYTYQWLRENDYNIPLKTSASKYFVYQSWDGSYGERLYIQDYSSLVSRDDLFLEWLEQLQYYGLVLVKDMPDDAMALENFVKNISHLRETNFGVTFNVESKPNPNNQAYTAEALPLHTDLPNQELPPGYQFLHCLNNESEGGESIFVDGFAVAERIQKDFPKHYDLLSRYGIPFRFHDETHDFFEEKPVIVERNGKISEINYNAHISTTFRFPQEIMRPYYLAYRCFMEQLNNPDLIIKFKLNSKEMVVFDNRRVLHGRDVFDPNTGKRHLRGCYVDRGDLKSRIRTLKKMKKIS